MDNLLALINFSKLKHKLLKEIFVLEYNNQVDSDKYLELLENYKMVCSVYNNKMNSLTEQEKNSLLEKILLINPNLFGRISFEKLLDSNSQLVILNRIMIDLSDNYLIRIYNKNILFNILGLETENEQDSQNINEYAVNEYMNQDFFNLLYLVVENRSKTEKIPDFREQLSKFKLALLTLCPALENRILLTNFSLPSTLKLVDKVSLETSGMFIDDYLNTLNLFALGYTEKIITDNLSETEIRNVYLDSIIIEALAILLDDKEDIEIIELLLRTHLDEEYISDFTKEKIMDFIEVLRKTKNNDFNIKKDRQYIKV